VKKSMTRKENKMNLREITAKRDRCQDSLVCPAVFEERGGDRLVIIGAITGPEAISGRVGPGEVAIEIDRGLVSRALAGPVSRLLMRAGL
jgi:hypothetical protein